MVPLGRREKKNNQPITSRLAMNKWQAENRLKPTARDWHMQVSLLPVNSSSLERNGIGKKGNPQFLVSVTGSPHFLFSRQMYYFTFIHFLFGRILFLVILFKSMAYLLKMNRSLTVASFLIHVLYSELLEIFLDPCGICNNMSSSLLNDSMERNIGLLMNWNHYKYLKLIINYPLKPMRLCYINQITTE